MNSLSGQSLMQHITDSDLAAVTTLLANGIVNLDERDQVSVLNTGKLIN